MEAKTLSERAEILVALAEMEMAGGGGTDVSGSTLHERRRDGILARHSGVVVMVMPESFRFQCLARSFETGSLDCAIAYRLLERLGGPPQVTDSFLKTNTSSC